MHAMIVTCKYAWTPILYNTNMIGSVRLVRLVTALGELAVEFHGKMIKILMGTEFLW